MGKKYMAMPAATTSLPHQALSRSHAHGSVPGSLLLCRPMQASPTPMTIKACTICHWLTVIPYKIVLISSEKHLPPRTRAETQDPHPFYMYESTLCLRVSIL